MIGALCLGTGCEVAAVCCAQAHLMHGMLIVLLYVVSRMQWLYLFFESRPENLEANLESVQRALQRCNI